ncbi:MAG: hypothetical protein H7066_01225 [Cytophagaceae bacterium]|nr:hypothetical protein [Gemmatimonadaceae bacterium]
MHEDALVRTVRGALPRPVAERVHVADGEGSRLELTTSAGAIASVVRHNTAVILEALRRDGWQFSGIGVRVQPQSMPTSLSKNVPRQWDSASRRPIEALYANLAPGPLKVSLGRLLRNR